MAPPPPSTASLFLSLVLRLISLVTMVLGIAILSGDNITIDIDYRTQLKASFKDIIAYRYMLSMAVIGAAYTVLQIGLTLTRIGGGPTSDSVALFDFYGDKIASYLLATGSAAGFGVTNDFKRLFESAFTTVNSDVDKFFSKGYASAGLLLLGFLCLAFLSINSSFNLPRKTTQ